MQQRPLLLRHHNKKEKNTKWIARYNSSLGMNGVDMNHCYRDFPSEIIGKSTLLTSSAPSDVSGSTIELVADVMQGKYGDGDARKSGIDIRKERLARQ